MPSENACVAVCELVADAAAAVRELRRQGIEAGCLSVVALDERSAASAVAYYPEDGRLRHTADDFALLWKELPGSAVLSSPGEPATLLAGPIAGCVIRTLDNEALFGDLGPIAAALYSLGIGREAARANALAVRQGRALLIVHGRARDVARGRKVLAAAVQRL